MKAFEKIAPALGNTLARLIKTGLGAAGDKRSYGAYDQSKNSLFHLYSCLSLAAKPYGSKANIHHREVARTRFACLDLSRLSPRMLHTSASRCEDRARQHRASRIR